VPPRGDNIDQSGTCSPAHTNVTNENSRDADVVQTGTDDLEKAYLAGTSHTLEVSKDLTSRNICIVALCLGIVIGITSIAVGCDIVVSGKVLLPSFLRGKYMTMGTIEYVSSVSCHLTLINVLQ
jgi:hypothetical protein